MSSAQARFARDHGARVGISPANHERNVFLYREDPWATYRWLVDDTGQAIEAETFRKSPSDAIQGVLASSRSGMAAR